jgi:hypothetical protein
VQTLQFELCRSMSSRLEIVDEGRGPVLRLLEGQPVDPQFTVLMRRALRTYEPDWATRRFNYDQAARKMLTGRRYLERLVAANEIRHLRIAGHVTFLGWHLDEFVAAMEHGHIPAYNPNLARRR